MNFQAFWDRFIVGKPVPPEALSPPPKKAPQPAKAPVEHPGIKLFSSGVKKIDEDHLAIRDAILNLQKDLNRGLGDQPLTEALSLLLQRMEAHFLREEAYLEHIGFPELPSHRAEHERFRTQVHQILDRTAAKDQTVRLELSSFLFDWFRNHTLVQDATFAKGNLPR